MPVLINGAFISGCGVPGAFYSLFWIKRKVNYAYNYRYICYDRVIETSVTVLTQNTRIRAFEI